MKITVFPVRKQCVRRMVTGKNDVRFGEEIFPLHVLLS
jgi:hypothetical protein